MSVYIAPALISNPALSSQPLDHARIGYQSWITSAAMLSGGTREGYPLAALIDPATYSRWSPAGDSGLVSLIIDLGAARTVDYIGIAAHTLAGASALTILSSTNGGVYTERLQIPSVPDNSAIMGLFAPVSARYWAFTVTITQPVYIGHIKIGQALAMQRAIYGGHAPVNLSPVWETRRNLSETGQWLGATRRGLRYRSEYQWRHLGAAWYRENFAPFVSTDPQSSPFFLAWRPQSYPDGAAYAWATAPIAPRNMGVRDYIEVGVTVEAYGGG
jgi:hypothetical protein